MNTYNIPLTLDQRNLLIDVLDFAFGHSDYSHADNDRRPVVDLLNVVQTAPPVQAATPSNELIQERIGPAALLYQLEQAVNNKDSREIIRLTELADEISWSSQPMELFQRWRIVLEHVEAL